MKGSKMLKWVISPFSDSVARWRELNNGAHVGRLLGWILIGLSVVYTSAVLILSSISVAVIPMVISAVFPLLLFWLLSYMAKIDISAKEHCAVWISRRRMFAIIIIPYLVLALFGWFTSNDTEWQWRQVLGVEPFDDWHPVIHTALVYVASLIRKSVRVALMVQVSVFALLVTWLYSTLRKYRYDKRLTYIIIVAAVANPFSTSLLRVLWKDTALGLAGLAITICIINILETKGAWLSGKRLAGLAVLLFLASFVRHNGFFYSLPLAVLLPFSVPGRNRGRAVACVALAAMMSLTYIALRGHWTEEGIIGVKMQSQGGSYQRFVEAVGLPMCIMAESYVRHPEKTPEEVSSFMETLCDRDFWEENYKGDFNSIKFRCWSVAGPPGSKIAAVGKRKFFRMFFETVKRNPVSAVKSFLRITSQAWAPFPETIEKSVYGGRDGIVASDVNIYQQMIIRSPLGAISSAAGFYLLCIILATLYGILKKGLGICILSLPFLCYQFGTMMLLTGFDYRFFYITVLSGGAVCMALLKPVDSSATPSVH